MLEFKIVKKSRKSRDWFLWNKAQEAKIDKPYHLTKTIFY